MVKRIDPKQILNGPVNGVDYTCAVCAKTTKTTKHTIFRIMNTFTPEHKGSGVDEWMCAGCVNKALSKGKLVLYHNPDGETPDDEMADTGIEEADSGAFEVSW